MTGSAALHFSDLKLFDKSPAHFFDRVTRPRVTTTTSMRIGTLVDMMLLTDKEPAVFDGVRRGKDWDTFRTKHAGKDMFTQQEHDMAVAICASARMDPMAIEYLGLENDERRTQVPLTWVDNGVPRATRGVDVIIGNRLIDLKVTNCTKPSKLKWHVRDMLWHAQVVDYSIGCKQNNIDVSGGLFLLCIESSPPYCVTSLMLSESAIQSGHKCISSWLEMYRACSESNVWPGYTQCVQNLDMNVDVPDLWSEEGDVDE